MDSKLADLLADIFDMDQEEITPETDLYEDLGADIQDMQEIFFNLEELYNIHAPLSDIPGIATVEDLKSYVKKRSKND